MLRIKSLEPEDIDELISFSSKSYGEHTYQATANYLNWMYRESPETNGWSDCLIAKTSETSIVGCVHKFILPCHFNERNLKLAVLQNIMVDEAYRGGLGIMMMRKIIKGQDLGFAPGVIGDFREVYRRFGHFETSSFWFRQILSPISLAKQLLDAKLGRSVKAMKIPRTLESTTLVATADPKNEQVAALTQVMQNQSRQFSGIQIAWTSELIKWRYFSGIGPRHLLIQSKNSKAICVVALGVRKGIQIARIMELDFDQDFQFFKQVVKMIKSVGAAVGFAFTTYPQIRDQLSSLRWRPLSSSPSSFTVGDKDLASHLRPSAGATDVGFESILTEVYR